MGFFDRFRRKKKDKIFNTPTVKPPPAVTTQSTSMTPPAPAVPLAVKSENVRTEIELIRSQMDNIRIQYESINARLKNIERLVTEIRSFCK